MYKTRFIFQTALENAGHVAAYVTTVLKASGQTPSDVRVQADDDEETLYCTVSYLTTTPTASNQIIQAWRSIDERIQVERVHVLDGGKFEIALLAGRNGRALRRVLAREVAALAELGVGSTGILEYLEECEQVVAEAKSLVESMRAPV